MPSTEDPNDDIRRYNNERRRIREAMEDGLIDEDDGEAFLAFGDHLRGEHKPSTASGQLGTCRRAAQVAHGVGLSPIVEWDETTFNRFMVRMADADFPEEHLPRSGQWSEGSRRNYRQHLKNLLIYRGEGWAEDIHIGAPAEGSVEREDLPTQDELTALWETAEHPRDECLVALPLVTWQRNAALRALRVGDVEIPEDGQTGFIRLNEGALGQKDAEGKRPLTWATGPVERFLAKHPRRDDDDFDDAPLLCVITDAGGAEKGTVLGNSEAYNRRLRTLAKRGGLDRDRWESAHGRRERTMRAHLLRYTGATRAALSDEYKESTIKAWASWTQDSPQLKRYVKVIAEDVLAAADAAHGIENELPQRPAFSTCPKCGGAIEEWHRACPNCTVLLSDAAFKLQETADELKEDVTEVALSEDLTEQERAGLRVLVEIADEPGELLARLGEAVDEG